MIRRRILQKKLRPYVSGQRASLQSMDHVALGVIPKSRPNSGYWNPALEEEEIVSVHPCGCRHLFTLIVSSLVWMISMSTLMYPQGSNLAFAKCY